MTSLIPLKEETASLRLAVLPGNVVEAQYESPEQVIAPNSRQSFEYLLFFGPKDINAIQPAGHQLERIVDFGMFDILAKPCLWLLNFIYGVIPNYGVAIIILTILTKILLWPLGTKSYKSMSQMKKLQPLIQEIREKYKNDRKKMNEEVMRAAQDLQHQPCRRLSAHDPADSGISLHCTACSTRRSNFATRTSSGGSTTCPPRTGCLISISRSPSWSRPTGFPY